MGNRFTRCFSSLPYSTVEEYNKKKRDKKYRDSPKEAIALELDDDEDENPGLILRGHIEV